MRRKRKSSCAIRWAFLSGLPAQNVLLYGDRGTGKSSTVHAVINEYADRGLRLIEVKKRDIITLPRLMNAIADGGNKKFIVFIDDLTVRRGSGQLRRTQSGCSKAARCTSAIC